MFWAVSAANLNEVAKRPINHKFGQIRPYADLLILAFGLVAWPNPERNMAVLVIGPPCAPICSASRGR